MNSIFWDMAPCILGDVNRNVGDIYFFRLQGENLFTALALELFAYSIFSSNLKMEAVCFSEASLDF
jgi:hypothetical protein